MKREEIINVINKTPGRVIILKNNLGFEENMYRIFITIPEDRELEQRCPYFNKLYWETKEALLRIEIYKGTEDGSRLTVYLGSNDDELVFGAHDDNEFYYDFFCLPYASNSGNYHLVKSRIIDFLERIDEIKIREAQGQGHHNNNYHPANYDNTIYPLAIVAIGRRTASNEEKIRTYCPELWLYLEHNPYISVRFTEYQSRNKTIEQMLQSAIRR